MKFSLTFFVTSVICISLNVACNKDDSVDPANKIPLITAVGVPIGIPGSNTIDGSGGTLTSADGVVQLTIPAGAVSTTTVFSIQMLNNNCPGGVGNAYRLLPEGTTFAQPVTINFNYADSVTTDEKFIGIAYQDADHTWFAPKVISLNMAGNNVSVQSKHFSDWSIFLRLALKSSKRSVFVSESAILSVVLVGELNTITNEQGVELNNLNIDHNIITSWQAAAGTVVKQGDDMAKFTAPAAIPSPNPVDVSVTFNNLTFEVNGTTISNPSLHKDLFIYDTDAYYAVVFTSSRTLQAVGNNWFTETDYGSLKVLLQHDSVTVYDVRNQHAEILPQTLFDPGPECTYTILDQGDGPYNVPDSVKLKGIYLAVNNQIYIGVGTINYPTGYLPIIQKLCTGGDPTTEGGGLIVTGPAAFSFDAAMEYQEFIQPISGGGAFPDGYFKTAITKVR